MDEPAKRRFRNALLQKEFYRERVLEQEALQTAGVDRKHWRVFQRIWRDGLSAYELAQRATTVAARGRKLDPSDKLMLRRDPVLYEASFQVLAPPIRDLSLKALRLLRRKTLRRKDLDRALAELNAAINAYRNRLGFFALGRLAISVETIKWATHQASPPCGGCNRRDDPVSFCACELSEEGTDIDFSVSFCTEPAISSLDPRSYADRQQQIGLLRLLCARAQVPARRRGPKVNFQRQALIDHFVLCL